jgi:ATP-dependent helicase/nuclease subunit B
MSARPKRLPKPARSSPLPPLIDSGVDPMTDHTTCATPLPRSLFTVPLGVPFLDALAVAVLDGRLPASATKPPDLLELPDITILLPTRRAARALQDAFLRAGNGRALLLPRIRPIAEGDEDRSLISGLAAAEAMAGDLEILPAVAELERQLIMTVLVQGWARSMREKEDEFAGHATAATRTPAQAAHLARELSGLLDMVETEGVSLSRLRELVPDELSAHWEQTLTFLQIVTESWPVLLNSIGKLSPADRRNQLVLAEAQRLHDAPPDAPVIAAGVTGSIPATARLMQVVATLPHGAIVLPGLDLSLDDESWEALAHAHPEHPQFGLARLLRTLNVNRADVELLAPAPLGRGFDARAMIVSEAMRPAPTTDRWHNLAARIAPQAARDGLAGITYLPAPTAQDEAETVALILREAAEAPDKTAALVSPDRILARRVAVRLESWGIRVDDSAGRPLAKTVAGSFLDLVIEVVAQDFAPAPLLSLLKHPLCRLAMPAADIRRAARALEIIAFRTAYLGYGLDELETFVERAATDVQTGKRRGRTVGRLWDEDWQAVRNLIARLHQAYGPLIALHRSDKPSGLRELTAAHIAVAEALAAISDEDSDASQLWRDEAGQTAALLFTSLADPMLSQPEVTPADYPEFYRTLIGAEAVRPTIPTHPRISIWGPFEARLQQPDVVILGGLNEATWPSAADPGPWLNRPMRNQLGLPLPEERIGHAAHDFTQLFGASEIYLTRAEKVDGNPTVPSRWLLRLQAVLASLGVEDVLEPRRPWLAWARNRDAIRTRRPITAPSPRPRLELRPRRLSVSAVETWIANPYALFADRILGLEPLPPVGQEPDASLRGSIIHDALGQFAANFPTDLPQDIAGTLASLAARIFSEYESHPRIRAFWMSRFERFAEWFATVEPDLRSGVLETLGERNGAHVIDAPGGPFTLTARADRIDRTSSGIAITDYKSGASLSNLRRKAKDGIAPQLLLETIIAEAGGFAGLDTTNTTVNKLRYISASGGEPPGQVVEVDFDDISAAATTTEAELAALIARFDDATTPYAALRRTRFSYDYDAYAHLARVAEWSVNPGEEAA